MSESPFIIDVTRDNYEQVMKTSFEVPVLIDFWANWCQPCHALMPVLAKLAEEYQGKFVLGKLNTEDEQEIAAQFGIRSIPNCKLFRDGQPVDEFMGAMPEQAVRQFLDRHVANESDALIAQAQQRLQDGDVAGARTILDELPAADADRPGAANLRRLLQFAEQVADAPAVSELEAQLETEPANSQALHQLALRLIVREDYDTAVDLLLRLVQNDREFEDDAGRRELLNVFELLGDDPRVGQYRRRMASLLH
ncbi:MAG: thioredoxin [Woeseiaceae bacterium]|nr:thioredoxin [Woeseiaceae bacterium]